MQLSVETIVWVALTLVVATVVGLFLMGAINTQSGEVGQRVYARLVSSNFMDSCSACSTYKAGYAVTIRIVNSGENGETLYLRSRDIDLEGFSENARIRETIPDISSATAIAPKESLEITLIIDSGYVSGTKTVIVKPHIGKSNGPQVALSVPIP